MKLRIIRQAIDTDVIFIATKRQTTEEINSHYVWGTITVDMLYEVFGRPIQVEIMYAPPDAEFELDIDVTLDDLVRIK